MFLDLGSLMFNMNLSGNGGTPSWGTALGQGSEYKYSVLDIGEILTGMVYCKTKTTDKIFCPLGKGGSRQEDFEFILSSVFQKIYFNDVLINDAKFLLLIVKQVVNKSGFHIGRQTLKYSPNMSINDECINQQCFDKIKQQLNLNEQSAWFINEITILNQDELHFIGYICNKYEAITFNSTSERHEYIKNYLLNNGRKLNFIDNKGFSAIFSHNLFGLHMIYQKDIFNDENPHIAIGWDALGDLSKIKSKDELYKLYEDKYPKTKSKTIGQNVGQIWRFIFEMKVGDYVVLADGNKMHIAKVLSEYYYDSQNYPNEDKTYVNRRKVEWLKTNIDRKEISKKFHSSLAAKLSFFWLSDYKSSVYDLLIDQYKVSCDEEDDNLLPTLNPRTNKIYPLNMILYGAPGTGKTYATSEIAVSIIENKQKCEYDRPQLMKKYKEFRENGQIVFTTFHQNYGYEDFIQGLRPENVDGVVEFNTIDGVFKRISDQAMMNPNNNFILIIDEINRANISKVFGELITLIEEDKRWGEVNELSIVLPSGDVFAVPNNLYLIGTMNTADKSISIIDVALRRRFDFIEKNVDLNLVSDTKLRNILENLNYNLRKELQSSDLLVGHAYFMNKTIEDLPNIFNRQIIPLLYEYYFDNENKVRALIEKLLIGSDYKINEKLLGRIKVENA